MTSNPKLTTPLTEARQELVSAIICLQEIAALKGTSKRQKVNCELAISWLTRHGYPLESNAYVPGKGFRDADNATETPRCPTCGQGGYSKRTPDEASVVTDKYRGNVPADETAALLVSPEDECPYCGAWPGEHHTNPRCAEEASHG